MAKKTTKWSSNNGVMYDSQIEAVEADIIEMGGDDVFFQKLVDMINDGPNDSISFEYEAIPVRISYRIMYSGYIGQLYTPVSNAEFKHQYSIIFYKKGVKPTRQLDMVIRHETVDEYKHYKELYGKTIVTIRDFDRTNVKTSHDYEDEGYLFDDKELDVEFSKLRLITDKFGKYSIYEYRETFYVCSETELLLYGSVYEHHDYDYDLNLDKGLFLIYGWEQIICMFNDGTMRTIHTR